MLPQFQESADAHKDILLDAGILDVQEKPTIWCIKGVFLLKPGRPVDVRLVVDFRSLNRVLTRPGYPYANSQKILRKLRPEDKIFISIDMTASYFQNSVHKDNTFSQKRSKTRQQEKPLKNFDIGSLHSAYLKLYR